MKKKILSLLLALCVLTGTVISTPGAMQVQAEENQTVEDVGENITYGNCEYEVLEDGTLELIGCTDKSITGMVVPSEIEGKKVSCIGYCSFFRCSSLSSIEIPDSVTNIGSEAFYGCSSLSSIEIPDSVTNIGSEAFYGCSSLSSIEIPDSVTSIGYLVFEETPWLIAKQSENPLVTVNAILIDGRTAGENVKIPDSITSIGSSAFWECSSLSSIEIPDSVTTIEASAFSGCSNLSSIEIPNSVISIGNGAFSRCSSLTDIEIPDSVMSIEASAFSGCSSLSTIKLSDSITSIKDGTFSYCSSLSDIEIPDTILHIGWSAFGNCSSLTRIKIPDSVTSIGNEAFSECSSLTDIEIPDSVIRIGAYAFRDTPWLINRQNENPLVIVNSILIDGRTADGDIEIPDSVTSIGDCAFWSCVGLMSIKMPGTVTSVGMNAFLYCFNLTSIEIPNSVVNIGSGAFSGCRSLSDIYYDGSESEWMNICYAYADDDLRNVTIHYSPSIPSILDNPSKTEDNELNHNGDTENESKKDDITSIPDNSVATITLSSLTVTKPSVTYTGKLQTPAVMVTDTNGQVVDSANYTITYTNNKNVGQAAVTVTGTGNYTGTLTVAFQILPKGTSLSKLSAKKKAFSVKWKKQSVQTTGYQLQYAQNAAFKGAKSIIVKKNQTVSSTVKKLKAKKKYYVRIRTYKNVKINGKTVKLYSNWSKAKTVTTGK